MEQIWKSVEEGAKNELNKQVHTCDECEKVISVYDDINSYHISDACMGGLSWWCEDCWDEDNEDAELLEEVKQESETLKQKWTKNN